MKKGRFANCRNETWGKNCREMRFSLPNTDAGLEPRVDRVSGTLATETTGCRETRLYGQPDRGSSVI